LHCGHQVKGAVDPDHRGAVLSDEFGIFCNSFMTSARRYVIVVRTAAVKANRGSAEKTQFPLAECNNVGINRGRGR
jgi:hypothetical protein